VTVTGPGGAGESRLAGEAAKRVVGLSPTELAASYHFQQLG
jgi:hypothetical protein